MRINPQIIIGCMSWGQWGKKLNTKEQSDLIEFCLEQGNNTFDHADIYGDYSTEAEFGKALSNSGTPRDRVQLISKCGIQMLGEARNNKVKHYNYSKEYIINSVENSLKMLKTDYLDELLLHRPSPLMQPAEIAEAISVLKKDGKIKNFGLSNFTPSQTELISNILEVSSNQIEFSLTQNEAMYDGSLDHLMLNNIRVMSWSPLGNVFKEDNEQTSRIKKLLDTLSKKYNCSEDSILLAWILMHPAKVSPVIGTTRKERIIQANKALDIKLELEDWFLLLEASQGKRVA